MGGDYESCKNMIYKLARDRYYKVSKNRPDLEFDDILGEAMCIYSTCLTTYDKSKGMKFTTYLYQNLIARLRDFTKFGLREIHHYEDFKPSGKNTTEVSYESMIPSMNYDLQSEIMECAKQELSYEGFNVLKYILGREWDNAFGKRRVLKPSVSSMCCRFGYSEEIMHSILYEIKMFWNKIGYKVA